MFVCSNAFKEGTGAEMPPANVSGIVIGGGLVSYWPIFSCPKSQSQSLGKLTRPRFFLVEPRRGERKVLGTCVFITLKLKCEYC